MNVTLKWFLRSFLGQGSLCHIPVEFWHVQGRKYLLSPLWGAHQCLSVFTMQNKYLVYV